MIKPLPVEVAGTKNQWIDVTVETPATLKTTTPCWLWTGSETNYGGHGSKGLNPKVGDGDSLMLA